MKPIYTPLALLLFLLPLFAFASDESSSSGRNAIYPPQKIHIRFDHKAHLAMQEVSCATCHDSAFSSDSSRDRLLPKPAVCDRCHGSNHASPKSIETSDRLGRCGLCHMGYKPGEKGSISSSEFPKSNLIFSHKKHLSKMIRCDNCHSEIATRALATTEDLPSMKSCFACHTSDSSGGKSKPSTSCTTCHLRARGGSGIETHFATGVLKPPRWLHNAEHTSDFIQRHKFIAGNDSTFCANCHKEDECTACHDGRVRPRNIHPNDYLAMHPIEARMATQRCTSCHHQQSFCLQCHQKIGLSMSGSPNIARSIRFHPPKDVWSGYRKPSQHAIEARRNLNACVSCHTERDCIVCHGARGVGGGFSPHGPGFDCASQLRRNPRPCFTCHLPDDGNMTRCR